MISKIILEAGINHFGKIREANKILNFFLSSSFQNLTFMIHKKEFYNSQIKKNKINFYLNKKFYFNALKLAHKKGKKIGLAVCDNQTYDELKDVNFDFYKILGISINNFSLLKKINKKNKNTYISLAIGDDRKIKNCLNYFSNKKKVNLIYTSMSYDPKDTNLSRISLLKKKFQLPVGYGHHYKNLSTVILSGFYQPDFYFFYIKSPTKNKMKIYPDNDHAIFFNKLKNLIDMIKETSYLVKNKNINTKIKLNANKIKR